MHSRGIFNNRHKPLQPGGLLDVNAWLFFGEQSPMVDEIQFPKYSQSIYLDRPVPLATWPTCRSPPSPRSICDGIVIARISAILHHKMLQVNESEFIAEKDRGVHVG